MAIATPFDAIEGRKFLGTTFAVLSLGAITGALAAAAAGFYWGRAGDVKRAEVVQHVAKVSNQLDVYFDADPASTGQARNLRCTFVTYEEEGLDTKAPGVRTTKKPIVLARAIWDGAPAAGASAVLQKGGGDIAFVGESSTPMAQVQVSSTVTQDRFATLAPGASSVVYWTTIESYWSFPPDVKTRMKADYAKASLKSLPPGTYQCTVSYEFDPNAITRSYRQDWNRALEFGPGAESLWNQAVTTRYKGKRTFVVR
jgi:hypothetical protein